MDIIKGTNNFIDFITNRSIHNVAKINLVQASTTNTCLVDVYSMYPSEP